MEKLSFEEAKVKAKQYPFVWASMMSEMCLGKTADTEILWEELLEARFFSESGEIHIFRCEKAWMAVEVIDEENVQYILVKSYSIAPRFRGVGKELLVKEYLEEDEDGQMYVKHTRLCGIKGGQRNGEK